MAFEFPLQSVLHFRESAEHQQELKLRAANQRMARVRRVIEHLDSRRQVLYSAEARQLSEGTTSAELRFALHQEAGLVRHRRELEKQLLMLEKARDDQREAFQRARRARQTLETLRETQLAMYRKEALRREQHNLDDLFLMRTVAQGQPKLRG
jgi:flagellar export protein FliJ